MIFFARGVLFHRLPFFLSSLFDDYYRKYPTGGDDVTQLCEASKDEFDEIIELVGMNQKPLHIRRLQKAIREWSKNPEMSTESKSEVVIPPSAKVYLKANQNLVPCDKSKKPEHEVVVAKPEDYNCYDNNIFMSQPLLPLPDDENTDSINNGNNSNGFFSENQIYFSPPTKKQFQI